MADKNEIAFDLEVKGVEQSIESVKDLKNAIKAAKDEQVKMAAAFGEGSKEYLDASKNVASLKDRVDDLNDSTKSLKGSGVEQLTQGFAQMKEGIMNLDFEKVKVGIAAMKSGMGAFATSAKTALQGVKGALIATGIGAFVVLLGTIIAYWDEIKGAISGVTEEQKRLNAAAKENLVVEQDKLKALEGSTNSLKLQGLSEKEILALKIKQLDAVYEAQEAQLLTTIQTQQAQESAEKRNKEILQGLISMTTAPLSLVLGAIDMAGKALGKNFGLSEKFKGSITDLVLGDEKENEEKRKKELDAQIQLLKDLKEKRAGFQLGINKIDEDAAKAASEKAKKLRDEKTAADLAAIKSIEDAKIAAIEDEELRAFAKEVLDNERRLKDIAAGKESEELKRQERESQAILFEANITKINADGAAKRKAIEDKAIADKAAADAKALADKKIITDAENAEKLAAAELAVLQKGNEEADLINQLTVKRDIELAAAKDNATQKLLIEQKYANDVEAINKAAAEKQKALELAKQNEILNFAQMSTQSHQALSDAFFAVKNRNLQKGSAAERKSAEQQFKINKALAIQSAVISGIQGVINALSAQSVVPEPFGTVLKVATAVGVGIAAAANIAKIASTKFDAGGGGGGGGGGATLPSAPPIPSPPSISTQQNNTNQSTSFDETGKRIGGDNEKQMTPVIQVKATVGVDEVSSKTNRVETLEKQSTF